MPCRMMLPVEPIRPKTQFPEAGFRETDQPLRDLLCANILKLTTSN